MKYVFGKEGWHKAYAKDTNRKRIWIYLETSDNKEIYLDEYDKWLTFQEYCDKHSVSIKKVGLQFRTHCVKIDTHDAEAVYIVRSLKAELYGKTINCYTVGLLKDNKVEKTMWIVPALVKDSTSIDNIEDCFEEAFVYNVKKSKTI
jgi:hypothetical protein